MEWLNGPDQTTQAEPFYQENKGTSTEFFDFEKEIEKLIAEEEDYLLELKAAQEAPTVEKPFISLQSNDRAKRSNQSEFFNQPENVSESDINCEFIQKPRKTKAMNFIEVIEQRRKEVREKLTNYTQDLDRIPEENFSNMSNRPDFIPVPLAKPDISGLIGFLEDKVANMGEESVYAHSGVLHCYQGKNSPLRGSLNMINVEGAVAVQTLAEENERLNRVIAGIHNQLFEYKNYMFEMFNKYDKKIEASNKKSTIKEPSIQSDSQLSKQKSSNDSKVFATDSMWKTVVAIMSGIELSVRACGLDRKLTALSDRDFLVKNKFEVSYPSLKGYKTAIIEDYAPFVFNFFRHFDGVPNEIYLESIGSEHLSKLTSGTSTTFRRRMKAVRDGLFEFMSYDKRFVIKEITEAQCKFLLSILKQYKEYLGQQPNTLLETICGLHSITPNKGNSGLGVTKKRYFMVTQNVLYSETLSLTNVYSLKGSIFKRKTKEEGFLLKDQNFLENNRKLELPPLIYEELLQQIENDTAFLAKLGIMNYSLLLGVYTAHYRSNLNKMTMADHNKTVYTRILEQITQSKSKECTVEKLLQAIRKYHILFTSTLDEVIFMGVVDFLSPFTKKKKVEHFFNKLIGREDFSSVPPDLYKQRLNFFLREKVFHPSSIDTDKTRMYEIQQLLLPLSKKRAL